MAEAALPVLYSFRRCPYAMRARWALAASGQAVELREVALRDKPAALLAASPKGTVPVLIDSDGRVIDESLDIMLWALRRSDPAHWLMPGQGRLDQMLALVQQCDGEFKHHLDRYKYPQRYQGASGPTHRAQAAVFLAALDARLAAHPHLFGPHGALADAAIAPFVRQFAAVDPAWFGQQPWPRLQAWLAALTGTALFEQVMAKPAGAAA